MEYICVMSLEGSLVSYKISKRDEQTFEAILRSDGRKYQHQLPVKFTLKNINVGWEVEPENNVIVPALIHCIEANN